MSTATATATPMRPRGWSGVRRTEVPLEEVLRHPGVWRRSSAPPLVRAQPTGWAALDERLPGGGWPQGALSEILISADGIGEWGLVLPALAALTRQRRRVAIVAPPYLPYAPALVAQGVDLNFVAEIGAEPAPASPPGLLAAAASAGGAGNGKPAIRGVAAMAATASPVETTVAAASWSAEQCLRSGACGAVLFWADKADYAQLRRWQLAAEHGGSLAFLFRSASTARQASPSALRLLLQADQSGTSMEILKCRGSFDYPASRLRWRA